MYVGCVSRNSRNSASAFICLAENLFLFQVVLQPVSYPKCFCKIQSLFPKYFQPVHPWLTFIAVLKAWHACMHASIHSPPTIHPSTIHPGSTHPSCLSPTVLGFTPYPMFLTSCASHRATTELTGRKMLLNGLFHVRIKKCYTEAELRKVK